MDDRSKRVKMVKFTKRLALDWLVTKLPSCLMMDILSRLPIITLFNCRCVCKTWLHLISDPYFAQLQLQGSPPPGILIKTLRLRRTCYGESRQLLLAQVTRQKKKSRLGVEKLKFNSKSKIPNLILINSCNGLLCFIPDFTRDRSVCVCNPILGEFITLPSTKDDRKFSTTFGFGFCNSTNEYKVVQTFNIRQETVVKNYPQAEICSIGKGKWKSLGLAPCMISTELPMNTYLNGCIHWIDSSNFDELGSVYSFNFTSEQFKLMPLPFGLDSEILESSVMLGVLKGCLCVSVTSYDIQCEIWVMKDYGVEESWEKMFDFDHLTLNNLSYYTICEPVAEFDDVNILMLFDGGFLVWYNTKTKKFRNAKISKYSKKGEFRTISYTPSFISLKDFAKEEDVEITRSYRRQHEQVDDLLNQCRGEKKQQAGM